jgi:hypothetical protein
LLTSETTKKSLFSENWFHGVIHHKRRFVVITYRPNESSSAGYGEKESYAREIGNG